MAKFLRLLRRLNCRYCGAAVLSAVLLKAGLLTGCAPAQPFVSPERMDRGLVVVLPGIEGRSFLNEAICRGLDEGGVNEAILLWDWTAVPLGNLRTMQRNQRKAGELAEMISRYRIGHPEQPVFLVAQSGGAAIAVWACEQLDPGVEVEGCVLLAGALSPSYPLTPALRNCRRGIVSFYSERDWILAATKLAGTMDGDHTFSAGRVGFKRPQTAGGGSGQYEKLHEIAWRPEMSEAGHGGSHVGVGAVPFVSGYVAPLIRADRWDAELLDRIAAGEGGLLLRERAQPAR